MAGVRFIRVVASAVAVAVVATTHAALPASGTFSDPLCPEAAQYVVALSKLKASDTPNAVYAAAGAASAAYDTCAKRHLASGDFEPGVHYSYTREASFDVVQARALLADGRAADARRLARDAKRLATDVYEWRYSDRDNRPSLYRDAAQEIVTAADEVLARLERAGAPVPLPSSHG
jgi:hypothetical protein